MAEGTQVRPRLFEADLPKDPRKPIRHPFDAVPYTPPDQILDEEGLLRRLMAAPDHIDAILSGQAATAAAPQTVAVPEAPAAPARPEPVAAEQAQAPPVEPASRFAIHRRTVAEHLARRNVPIRRGGVDPSPVP